MSRENYPERLDALEKGSPFPAQWRFHHLHRYYLARRHCQDRNVLDLGCGLGYGSHLLGRVGRSVLGVDADRESIQYARQRYSGDRVAFEVEDATRLDLDRQFDVVVCFEVLEHVVDASELLRRVSRLLRPRGQLILSSPNRRWTSGANPYHLREYNASEFRSLLAAEFDSVKIRGQYLKRWRAVAACRWLETRFPSTTWVPSLLGWFLPAQSAVLLAFAKRR